MLVVTRLRHGLGVLATLVCAVAAALIVVTGPEDEALAGALRGVGVLALVGLLGALPLVRVDERGVLVRNPWRTWRIGWGALDDVGFGWSLWLRPRGTDRLVRAAAAPGPASMLALYQRSAGETGVLHRDAETAASTSMAPALLVVRQARERWARGPAASSDVRTGWSWGGLALTVVGAAALVAGVLLA